MKFFEDLCIVRPKTKKESDIYKEMYSQQDTYPIIEDEDNDEYEFWWGELED